jgi:anaerobic magnesium-protoporphyrin IX monomethyl ester cyclase
MKKNNTVLLVYPKIGIDPRNYIPYSLLYTASPLVRDGFKVKIIDQRILGNNTFEVIKKSLKSAICVGISSMSGPQIKNGLEISNFIKTQNPKIPIVWGGVHPSVLPEQTLENPNIDVVVRGEGEETFSEVVKCLKDNKSLNKLKGISFKDPLGRIFHNEDRNFINLNKLPQLPYHLIDIKQYIHSSIISDRSIQLYTSRGCPHRCRFCYNKAFNKSRWRAMNADRIIKDIKYLKSRCKFDCIYFMDDNFFVDVKRVEEFARKIIKEKLNIKWYADCRIDYLKRFSDDFIKLIYKSGCREMIFGIEAGSEKMLKYIDKGITKKDIIETNKRLNKFKIWAFHSFIIGFPNETQDDVDQMMDLIDTILRDNSYIRGFVLNVYRPFPGSELYDVSLDMGFDPPKTLKEWGDSSWFTLINTPWTKNKRNYMENVSLISQFITLRKTGSPLIDFIWKCYYPIAKFRWRYRLFFTFFDTLLFDMYKKYKSIKT